MIETHREPDKAWSDAKQQITPSRLGEILGQIKFRNPTSRNRDFINHLEELREEIDHLDQELYEIIASRMKIVDQIGFYKRDNNVTIFQKNRWKEMSESRNELARKLGLSEEFMDEIFKIIHENSIKRQTYIMNSEIEKTKDAS